MKRSILVALGTSVLFWLIFTGFDYLAKVQKYKFSIFSPDRTIFGWSEAIAHAMDHCWNALRIAHT